ncbi:hypothetical protein [Tenacibaculum amylolyticum]|uniref:hypothetical protein n=1 Tax=Tenacibaculum amylolyticum TaxID=104269 RepID=UPI0038941E3A
MKRHLFLLLIFTTTVLCSQTKEDVIITIDPFGKNIYPKKRLEIGSTVKFKITNVNVFKLTGNINGKGETQTFEIPSIFKNESDQESQAADDRGDDSTPDLESLDSTSFFKNSQYIQENIYELYGERSLLEKSLKNAQERKSRRDMLKWKNKIAEKDKEIEKLNKLLKEVQTLLASKKEFKESQQIFTYYLQKVNNYLSLEKQLNSQLKDSIFIRNKDNLQATSKELYDAVFEDSATEDLKEVTATIETLLDSYSQMKVNYNILNKTLEKDTFNLEGELKDSDKKTTFKITKATVAINREKLFEKEMAFANKIRDSIAKPETQSLIKEKAITGASLYNKIENETFDVYTDAFQLNDDEVTLTPKLTNTKGKVVYEFESIKLKTKCKWKVNFSTGYLLSFIGNDNYTYRKDSTGIVGVKPSNTNKITHALGGMIHAYPNLWNGFQPAISSGLSVDTNGTLGFYFGGSVLFTEKNRLALSFGYSLTSVQRLDRGNLTLNEMTNQLDFSNTQDLEIRYNDVYKGAFFIGVTYNLSE